MPEQIFFKFARRVFLSLACGTLAGAAAFIFLYFLDWATDFRTAHPAMIWALPAAGLLVGLIYEHCGKDVAGGNNLILDEIHDPRRVLPFKMAPLILFGTILTHLFGGSAGREGTAVQMGASLSDQFARFFRVENWERRVLLMAGAGAGFGAAIGAPFAGAMFGMEVVHTGRPKLSAWMECLIASFAGYYTALLLRAPHSAYPEAPVPAFDLKLVACIALAGVVFGISARLFVMCTHLVERAVNAKISYPPLKPLLGGALVAVLFYLEGTYRFAGLGIPQIQTALRTYAGWEMPFLKSLFTSLTVGTGFKGGEFIPLVFIGTTLGSALSSVLPVATGLLAAVGFAAVFAGAANTPLACTLMAVEIFGYRIAPYALIACYLSYQFSGSKGIYKTQRRVRAKFIRVRRLKNP